MEPRYYRLKARLVNYHPYILFICVITCAYLYVNYFPEIEKAIVVEERDPRETKLPSAAYLGYTFDIWISDELPKVLFFKT
mgnify:CR=1 FL=1